MTRRPRRQSDSSFPWKKKAQAELPPIGQRGAWLQLAEALGIGRADPAAIDLAPVEAR